MATTIVALTIDAPSDDWRIADDKLIKRIPLLWLIHQASSGLAPASRIAKAQPAQAKPEACLRLALRFLSTSLRGVLVRSPVRSRACPYILGIFLPREKAQVDSATTIPLLFLKFLACEPFYLLLKASYNVFQFLNICRKHWDSCVEISLCMT